MGYAEYLRELLRPLRLYSLDTGYGAVELEQEGKVLDQCYNAIDQIETEAFLNTALDYGLEAYEALFPYRPASENLEDRRQAILALLRIDGGCFTIDALNDTLRGCGIHATVRESDTAMTVEITFPDMQGIPENMGEIQKRIEQILPCHLEVVYCYKYITWRELEAWFPNWAAIEAEKLDWTALELYVKE